MNWGTIRDLARVYLQDTSSRIWSDNELLTYANDVLSDLTKGSEANLKRAPLPLTSGTRLYTLPDDLFELRGVRIGNKKIFGTHPLELEEYDSQYLTATGTPQWYYQEDSKSIAFYPIPSWTSSYTSVTFTETIYGEMARYTDGSTDATFDSEFGVVTDVLDTSLANDYLLDSIYGVVTAFDTTELVCEISYIYLPSSILSDADVPDLPTYMHYAVMYGVLWYAFDREGQGQNEALSLFFKGRYEELEKEWFTRNVEWAKGQSQFASQMPTRWGADLDWRFRTARY